MAKVVLFALLAAAVATAASAETLPQAQESGATGAAPRRMLKDPQAETVGNFDWKAYYPAEAMSAGKGGEAIVQCEVNADRRLNNCDVVSEKPANLGFGQAAVRLSTDVTRLAERDARGAPTAGGWVTLRMSFKVPD